MATSVFLSVFDYFVGLALKWLILIIYGKFVPFSQIFPVANRNLYVTILMCNRAGAETFGKYCLGVRNVPEYVVS